jgi:DNA-binding NarL/FixJ family response regulator
MAMNEPNPLPGATPPGTTKHRVFVVDDHALMRRSIVEAIEREPDLEVCGQAWDVPGALADIRSLGPQIVLTDLQLKASSGLDLIKALKEQAPKTIVVATTMFDVRRNERLARMAGAAGFCSKHDGPEKLITVLHEALASVK